MGGKEEEDVSLGHLRFLRRHKYAMSMNHEVALCSSNSFSDADHVSHTYIDVILIFLIKMIRTSARLLQRS